MINRYGLHSQYYSPEYIEVEEPDEPVPTQDSCLQVTEEDIALSMMQAMEVRGQQHPLRALSEENLTVVSHFTGESYSQGTASDWEPISSDAASLMDEEQQREFFNNQLEHLAKLQHIYQQQQTNAGGDNGPADSLLLHPTPLSALSTSHIGSFKVSSSSSSFIN